MKLKLKLLFAHYYDIWYMYTLKLQIEWEISKSTIVILWCNNINVLERDYSDLLLKEGREEEIII